MKHPPRKKLSKTESLTTKEEEKEEEEEVQKEVKETKPVEPKETEKLDAFVHISMNNVEEGKEEEEKEDTHAVVEEKEDELGIICVGPVDMHIHVTDTRYCRCELV